MSRHNRGRKGRRARRRAEILNELERTWRRYHDLGAQRGVTDPGVLFLSLDDPSAVRVIRALGDQGRFLEGDDAKAVRDRESNWGWVFAVVPKERCAALFFPVDPDLSKLVLSSGPSPGWFLVACAGWESTWLFEVTVGTALAFPSDN